MCCMPLEKMKIEIIISIILIGLMSCSQNNTAEKEETLISEQKPKIEFKQIEDEEAHEERISELYCDTTLINGKKYIGCHNSETNFYIINEKLDTIYRHKEWVNSVQFTDFNNDGYQDILFEYMTNVPDILDLALFDAKSGKFTLVEDFSDFPAPNKIGETGFYYSYHRSGCADSNWDSDLFVIKNHRAIRIGNISGIGCEGTGKTGISISKVREEKKELIKEILREPGYYDDKWDFIKNYWTKNHEKFK